MIPALRRVLIWTFTAGGVSFAVGFFGPMIWAPEANQGPLLGILITGPLGTVAGFGIGVVREMLGYTATPLELMARSGLVPVAGRQALRIAAAVGGVILLITGITGLPQGAGRPAAASIVVAGALLWYAAVGHSPGWFTR